MFKTGEYVLKNGFGVLEIVDCLKQSFSLGKSEDYYKLISLDKKTVLNVPVERAGNLICPVLKKTEAKHILENILDYAVNLDPAEKVRRKFLEEKCNGGRADCLMVVGSVLERVVAGKKLAYFEKTALDVAGDKVFSEIAFVLNMTKDKAKTICYNSAGVEM